MSFSVVLQCMCSRSVLFVQEQKRLAGEQALKKGSLYLQQIGRAAPSLGHKLKTAAAKSAAAAKKKPRDILKLASLDDANKCLPKVVGCSLQLVGTKQCWTCYYPGALPGSKSITWGAKFNKRQCLRAVLIWAWAQHFEKTSEVCPFNFDEAV